MTDPLLRATAVTVADHPTSMADRIRRGRPVGAVDANMLDHAARLLKELAADPGTFAGSRPPNPMRGADMGPLQRPAPRRTFDERRGGARRP